MRKLSAILCLVLVAWSMFIHAANAKRFGGGRSFGYQRSVNHYSRPQPAQMPLQKSSTASGASKWLGPLAGLAAGGLLASLFMGHGIGSGILSWLLVLGGGLVLWSFIRNKFRPAAQFTPVAENTFRNHAASFTPIQNDVIPSAPVGFDATAMLRDAKVQFIRLQTAYDNKNLNDLREFTTPEVFAEVQLQLQERGDERNQTEVVKLEAELLDLATELQDTIASVSFSGLIRENPNEAATPFNEIWHFKKSNSAAKWLVAGLQQQTQ